MMDHDRKKPAFAISSALSAAAVPLLSAALVVVARADIDVAIPPGSPLEWLRALPAHTVSAGPLLPSRTGVFRPPFERRYAEPTSPLSVPGTLGSLQILTWDVANHLSWTEPSPPEPVSVTGTDFYPYPPPPSMSLYWISIATLLRLALHPAQTSRAESLGFLLELGQGALAALLAARVDGVVGEEAKWLANAIGPLPRARPKAVEGSSPFDTMMNRFAAEELVAAHPYDPSLEFGRRLFLLGELMAPHVGAQTRAEHAFLRQNAVAALGRYGSYVSARDLLIRVVAEAPDPVSRARAITSLGELRSLGAVDTLTRALESAESSVEAVLLIHALGGIGDGRAVPSIMAAGDRFREIDVTLASLMALARLSPAAGNQETLKYLDRARSRALRAGLAEQPTSVSPDVPDPRGVRQKILLQAVLLARAAQEPEDGQLAAQVLELARGTPDYVDARWIHANRSLGAAHPMVAYAFVDALVRLGPEGRKHVETIARDKSCDPALRCYAVTAFGDLRLALELVQKTPPGRAERDLAVGAFAFELLARSGHSSIVKLAADIMASLARRSVASLSAAEKHLYQLALRTLGEHGALKAAQLIELLEQCDLRPRASASLVAEVAARVRRLAEAARSKSASAEQRIDAAIMALLDFVLQSGVQTPVRPNRKEAAAHHVAGLLQRVQSNAASRSIVEIVTDAIVSYLLDVPQTTSAAPRVPQSLEADPLFEETVILELGRTGEEEAVSLLRDLLTEASVDYRGAICLALAATKNRAAGIHLVYALQDADPFVRLCAFLGLKELTAQDFGADWLYGPPAEREKARQQYALWLLKNR
ncbi:MAG: HEAT repeat domain-containing protein [Planctomycetota bacterium]